MPRQARVRVRRWTFPARGADGRPLIVHVATDMIEAASADDPHGVVVGNSSLRLENGHTLNTLEKGRYQDTATQEIITSDAPGAFDPSI